MTNIETQIALPTDGVAAVEAGLMRFHTIIAERDDAQREVKRLNTELAAARVSVEAYTARLADMESRVASAMLVRDQAVADRAKYETLFISLQAQLRAFAIPAAPLVRENEESATQESWTCPQCQQVNSSWATECGRCGRKV